MKKKRMRKRMLNLFAFALLAVAIYLNVFQKDQDSNTPVQIVKVHTSNVR